MSQIEKLLDRLFSKPTDFTYDEAKKILYYYGFYEDNKGKTSGSRVQFRNYKNVHYDLHKPHPNNILKEYQLKELIRFILNWRNKNE